MPRVVHFEIPADQPERAVAFYQKVFGWQCTRWEGPMPYWLVVTGTEGPGIDGGLMPRQTPGQGTTNVVDVADIDQAVAAIVREGGTITAPKMAIPGVGQVAYAVDTEGNAFGVIQAEARGG